MTSWEPVVDYLLENMQKQTYKKDERLPSEHELAQRFDLTRIEVRKAYDRLKEMGYVYSQQGKGNYYAGYLEKVELVLSSTDLSLIHISYPAIDHREPHRKAYGSFPRHPRFPVDTYHR